MDPTAKAVIEQTLLEIASGCRTLAPSLEFENALLEAGYVIAPVEPSSIMAMRGYQATPVFEGSDGVFDYITLEDAPHVPGFTYERKFDDEERGHLVAAAAYRGAIRGYQEWNRRRDNGEGSSTLGPSRSKMPSSAARLSRSRMETGSEQSLGPNSPTDPHGKAHGGEPRRRSH
jgi:hypothetical protein